MLIILNEKLVHHKQIASMKYKLHSGYATNNLRMIDLLKHLNNQRYFYRTTARV